jgi:hypothetical protein
LKANHYRVLRIPASRIYRDLDGVIEQIRREATAASSKRRPSRASNSKKPVQSSSGSYLTSRTADPRKTNAWAERNEGLNRPPPKKAPPTSNLSPPKKPGLEKAKFRCTSCEHDFVDVVSPIPTCRRCESDDRIVRLCVDCEREPPETGKSLLCRRCSLSREARGIAGDAAGWSARGPDEVDYRGTARDGASRRRPHSKGI